MVLREKIRDEFKYILDLMDFDKKAHEIYRNWYVDGRIYYHKVIDFKKPHEGLQEIRYIDAMKMRYVKKQKQTNKDRYKNPSRLNDDNPMDYEFPQTEEFFIYNPKISYPTGSMTVVIPQLTGIKMTKGFYCLCYKWTSKQKQRNNTIISTQSN